MIFPVQRSAKCARLFAHIAIGISGRADIVTDGAGERPAEFGADAFEYLVQLGERANEPISRVQALNGRGKGRRRFRLAEGRIWRQNQTKNLSGIHTVHFDTLIER